MKTCCHHVPFMKLARSGGHRRRHIERKNRASRRHVSWSDVEIELNAQAPVDGL